MDKEREIELILEQECVAVQELIDGKPVGVRPIRSSADFSRIGMSVIHKVLTRALYFYLCVFNNWANLSYH